MASQRTTPYGAFNFVVSIDGHGDLAAFSDVSGLSTDITIAEYRYGNDPENHVRKVPGMHKVSDVTLKRGIVNSQSLWGWISQARVAGPEGKPDAIITLRDEAGQAVQRWKLSRVLPMKYSGPTLAAKGGGEVAMEELVLSVEGIEIDGP
jgi:phage tail-like protein